MSLRNGLCFARRVRDQALLFHCVRLFLAPRATSSRSGCPSSAALRPAFACDRAGTARHADPRCSPPSHETLSRGQRLHPPVWPLGARTLRRHGSSRPRGGSHHHPPALPRIWSRRVGMIGLRPCTESISLVGGGYSIRPAGANGHPSGGCGDPARGSGWGIGDAVSCGHRGAPARDALPGRSRRSLGALRAGASQRQEAAHPRAKENSGTECQRTLATRGIGNTKASRCKRREGPPVGQKKLTQ